MPASGSDPPVASSSPVTHSSQNTSSAYIVTSHSDNSVTLWKRSATSWDAVATLPSQKSSITDVSFSPDTNPNTFAISKADGIAAVYVFTISTNTTISETANLRDADTLSAIAFSDTGHLATLGGGVLRIYGKRWGLLTEIDNDGKDVSFAPGGKAIIAGGTIFRCVGEDFEWILFSFIENSDGILFVDWGREGLIGVGREDGVEIWELQRGDLVKIAEFEERDVRSVEWDPVGDRLKSVHNDDVTRVWAKDGASWEWELREVLHNESTIPRND